MLRWVRRAVLLVPLVVLVAFGLLVLTARPNLDHDRNNASDRWSTLRPRLDARYTLLAAAASTTASAGGPAAAIAQNVQSELARWSQTKTSSVAAQVSEANTLEALGRRLSAAVDASARLQSQAPVVNAVHAYSGTTPPAEATPFNAAVRTYEDARNGFMRRPIAGVLGYDQIPQYAVTTT